MYKDILAKVTNNETLTAEEISEFISLVANDEVTPVQIAGFQVGLLMKGTNVEELAAFANAMRESGIKLLRFPRGKPHFKAIFDWFCNNYSFYKVVLESLCINGKI